MCRGRAGPDGVAIFAPVRHADGVDRTLLRCVPGGPGRWRIGQLPRVRLRLRDERLDHRSPAPEQARPGCRPMRRCGTLPRGHRAEPDASAVRCDPRGTVARAHRHGHSGRSGPARGIHPLSGQWRRSNSMRRWHVFSFERSWDLLSSRRRQRRSPPASLGRAAREAYRFTRAWYSTLRCLQISGSDVDAVAA